MCLSYKPRIVWVYNFVYACNLRNKCKGMCVHVSERQTEREIEIDSIIDFRGQISRMR